jgi:2-polyprenyl-3-methyl-5-hydroxy-6-metoxy-1,4-benzoquinol methylase
MSGTPGTAYSATGSARLLWQAYAASGLPNRLLAAVRPFIARFDRVVTYIRPDMRVLDIGCGNGQLLCLAHHYAPLRSGFGVDINPAAIDAANRMAAAATIPLTFRQGASTSDWPADTFDLVTMVDVLHHIPHGARRSLVEAALARVAPGGLFLYKDMCARPAVRRLWNQVHDLMLAQQLVVVEPIAHVVSWVTSAGFSPVASERYVGAALYGHELEVFRRPDEHT